MKYGNKSVSQIKTPKMARNPSGWHGKDRVNFNGEGSQCNCAAIAENTVIFSVVMAQYPRLWGFFWGEGRPEILWEPFAALC